MSQHKGPETSPVSTTEKKKKVERGVWFGY